MYVYWVVAGLHGGLACPLQLPTPPPPRLPLLSSVVKSGDTYTHFLFSKQFLAYL